MHFVFFLQFHANHDLTWSTSVSFTKIQNPVVLCSIDSRVRQRHEAWMDSCFGSFKCPSAVSAFIAALIKKKKKSPFMLLLLSSKIRSFYILNVSPPLLFWTPEAEPVWVEFLSFLSF